MNAIDPNFAGSRYERCIAISKRVRWDIDKDVMRGRSFSPADKFLPDGLSKVQNFDFLSAEEKTQDTLEFDRDDLYYEAARLVVSSGQASISYLQRRLRIGFSRAARLVDMMEAEGLVSPSAGAKPREVLVDKGYFEDVDSQLR